MYQPPEATKNTQSRKALTRVFLLLFFTAIIAAGVGFIEGQKEVLSLSTNKANSELRGERQVAASDSASANQTAKTDEEVKNPCETGQEDECLNKCTTSYQKQESPVKTCSVNNVSSLSKRISDVMTCAKDNKISIKRGSLVASSCFVKTPEELAAKATGCELTDNECRNSKNYSDNLKKFRTPKTGLEASDFPILKRKCGTEVSALMSAINNRYNEAGTKVASIGEGDNCTDKGSVTCIENAAGVGKSGYTCWSKKGDGRGSNEFNGNECSKPGYYRANKDRCEASKFRGGSNYQGGVSRQPPVGSGGGSGSGFKMPQTPKGGSGSGGGGKNEGSRNCNSYYYRLTNRSDCKKPTKPTCLLLINKTNLKKGEALRVKWQTQYATKGVNFTTTTGTSIGSVAESGERTIYPKNSGAITLNAKGDINRRVGVDENECTKTVNVNVSGEVTTEKGEYPPRVSCIPGVLEEGKRTKVVINWSCPSGNPTKATGVNFNTDDKVSGTANVYPTSSTRYDVNCYSEEKVIGKNSCVVLTEKPTFDIIVWPQSVGVDEKVRVSWGSLSMTTCKVKGPGGFLYDQTNGVVVTTPFKDRKESEAIYTIECASKFGKTTTRDVAVEFSQE